MAGSEPPLADVVSFAERARARRRTSASSGAGDAARGAGGRGGGDRGGELQTGDGAPEPAVVAREAMFRRFGKLVAPSGRGLRSVDDALAVLEYDSASDPTSSASVRGAQAAGSSRQLSFRADSFTLEVQVEGPSYELMCQVVPPQPASLEIRHRTGCLDLGSDGFGTFYAGPLPAGEVSLRCVPAGDAAPAATSWFSLSPLPG